MTKSEKVNVEEPCPNPVVIETEGIVKDAEKIEESNAISASNDIVMEDTIQPIDLIAEGSSLVIKVSDDVVFGTIVECDEE